MALSFEKVQLKTLTLPKLGQLALKIISLRVIRELIIVIKYVTKGVNFAVNARFCYLKRSLFLALNLERPVW